MPDEASMEVFEEEDSLCIDLDNQIRVPAGHKAAVKLEVSLLDEDDGVELADVGLDYTNAKDGKALVNKQYSFYGFFFEKAQRKNPTVSAHPVTERLSLLVYRWRTCIERSAG